MKKNTKTAKELHLLLRRQELEFRIWKQCARQVLDAETYFQIAELYNKVLQQAREEGWTKQDVSRLSSSFTEKQGGERAVEKLVATISFYDEKGNVKEEEFVTENENALEGNADLFAKHLENIWGRPVSWRRISDAGMPSVRVVAMKDPDEDLYTI